MPPFTCLMDASVRRDRREDLEALIRKMFSRRHHNRVSAGPSGQMWLTVELVQALRRVSQVYREFSTKTTGPLPFEIGFLRIRDNRLEPISDPLHIDQPELFVRMISEFVKPGARIRLTRSSTASQREKNGSAKAGGAEDPADERDGDERDGDERDGDEAGPSGGLWRVDGVGEVSKHAGDETVDPGGTHDPRT